MVPVLPGKAWVQGQGPTLLILVCNPFTCWWEPLLEGPLAVGAGLEDVTIQCLKPSSIERASTPMAVPFTELVVRQRVALLCFRGRLQHLQNGQLLRTST